MTIDEAIKILDTAQSNLEEPPPAEFAEALLLGIEALRRLDSMRHILTPFDLDLLLGETEE